VLGWLDATTWIPHAAGCARNKPDYSPFSLVIHINLVKKKILGKKYYLLLHNTVHIEEQKKNSGKISKYLILWVRYTISGLAIYPGATCLCSCFFICGFHCLIPKNSICMHTEKWP
jgi:hypothetical protein